MKLESVPSSFVYFLSGIGAAAGVNFLTSIPTSELEGVQACVIAGFSLPWFGASLMLALTAAALEEGHQKCDRLLTSVLNETEIAELRDEVFKEFQSRIILRAMLAAGFVILGGSLVIMVHPRDYRTTENRREPERAERIPAKQTSHMSVLMSVRGEVCPFSQLRVDTSPESRSRTLGIMRLDQSQSTSLCIFSTRQTDHLPPKNSQSVCSWPTRVLMVLIGSTKTRSNVLRRASAKELLSV